MGAAPERRYARQEAFSPIGPSGQARIGAARAVVVGVGATGSVIASILARAGVGSLRIIDRDIVEATNLQRQALYVEADARDAVPKAVAAAERLAAANAQVRIEAHVEDLTPRNVARLLGGADIVLDGTDNFETRLLVNDWCVRARVPWVYAGVIASSGHALAILPLETACFRCYIPDAPPPGSVDTCDTAGVIAPAVHAIAGVAAAEGIKVLAGRRDAVARRLITLDVWSQRFHAIEVERDPACPCCAKGRFDFLDGRDLAPAAALCGRDAVHIRAPAGVPAEDEGGASGAGEAARIDLDRLARRLQQSGDGEVRLGPAAVRFKAGEIDATFFADGRAIVKGTGDVGRARAFYARWIGV